MDAEDPAVTKQGLEKEEYEKLAAVARRKVTTAIAKRRKLLANLRGDLEKHGDPDRWKRYGDLILANVHTTSRDGDILSVTDYFDDSTPVIEIAGDSNKPLSEIAEDYFRRYTKARNGKRVIAERIAVAEADIANNTILLSKIDQAIEAQDSGFLTSVVEPKRKATEVKRKKKAEPEFNGARRFVSSDGFEIMIGRKAKDNDFLTFRIARSLDTWMHAADFPGSHVVIRNPNRKEIPQKTLHEAAKLAAFYSNARKLDKAAVNYTQKKYVNKPRRAAPGLVSLASFKTLLVRPEVPESVSNE